ncbi:MAG: hypothetical protein WA815_17010, partial [Terracidiphilus sp.]
MDSAALAPPISTAVAACLAAPILVEELALVGQALVEEPAVVERALVEERALVAELALVAEWVLVARALVEERALVERVLVELAWVEERAWLQGDSDSAWQPVETVSPAWVEAWVAEQVAVPYRADLWEGYIHFRACYL